jgi:hypothetical protein
MNKHRYSKKFGNSYFDYDEEKWISLKEMRKLKLKNIDIRYIRAEKLNRI